MNIKLTEEQVKSLINALDDDIQYKTKESGCADEYKEQINAYIMLMEKLDIDVSKYKADLKEALRVIEKV